MATTNLLGYGPEHGTKDAARLDGVIDKLLEHMKIFEQRKVSAEEIKTVETYKNSACAVARSIAVKVECLAASGRTAAQRKAMEQGIKIKTA
jgi:polyphosphate kinase